MQIYALVLNPGRGNEQSRRRLLLLSAARTIFFLALSFLSLFWTTSRRMGFLTWVPHNIGGQGSPTRQILVAAVLVRARCLDLGDDATCNTTMGGKLC